VTISLVNGYLCETSCDVAKAKTGQDPHPRITAQAQDASGTGQPGTSPRDPAVTFGGRLAATQSAHDAAPGGNGNASLPPRPGSLIDVSA